MFSNKVLKTIAGAVFLVMLVIGLTGCSSYKKPATYLKNPQTLTSAAQTGR